MIAQSNINRKKDMENKEKRIKKIAFVNQRYGTEVIGGSESYTKAMAEHLAKTGKVEVEVLTSKAVDFKTWQDYYTQDVEKINSVTVRRFSIKWKRSRIIQRGAQILMHNLHIRFKWLEKLRLIGRGPYVPDLVGYIREHKNEYDAFVFVTYMYYPAYFGAKEVYDKAYFIPTAHDEEPIYMRIFRDLFTKVKGIIYLTEEEQALANRLFGNQEIPSRVLGMGIEVPGDVDTKAFCEKYKIEDDYILYAGRIDENKGCKELFDYFLRWKKENASKLKLVLMGKAFLDIPKDDSILYLGFVSDADKYAGMKGAKIICLPSKYESFSISLLEGMAYGHSALVNGESEVLKGHVDKSGGGCCYYDYESFAQGLNCLLQCDKGLLAKEYVTNRYAWAYIENEMLDFLSQKN